METAIESGSKPLPEFQDDVRDPLVELNLTDSTELWLIQWPKDHSPDLDGQQVLLDLNGDGELGNFQVSPGNSYKVVSCAYQEPDATVFTSSSLESKIVGKVTRHVSLVHYPDPTESIRPMNLQSTIAYCTSTLSVEKEPSKSINQSSKRRRNKASRSGEHSQEMKPKRSKKQ